MPETCQAFQGQRRCAVAAFTLMKVIGRDVWIGVWAFVLSLIAPRAGSAPGFKSRTGGGEIWRRFRVRAGISDRLARRHGDRAGYDYAAL